MRIETWKDGELIDVVETPDPEPAAPIDPLEKLKAFLAANPDVAEVLK